MLRLIWWLVFGVDAPWATETTWGNVNHWVDEIDGKYVPYTIDRSDADDCDCLQNGDYGPFPSIEDAVDFAKWMNSTCASSDKFESSSNKQSGECPDLKLETPIPKGT